MNDDLKVKMNELMYSFTKDAARSNFAEYREEKGISAEDYEAIKKEWAKIGITSTYL